MAAEIRAALVTDAEAMLDIYAPLVRSTAKSFEFEPPSLADFRERIAVYSRTAPWLVCLLDDMLAGYAYATPFRARPAYQWTVEVAVYVSDMCQRRGVARALYAALLELLSRQGFRTAIGVIVLPNPASVVLHESFGFELIGVFPGVGFKLNAWHDTGWWTKTLNIQTSPPGPLRLPGEVLLEAQADGLFGLIITSKA